MERFAASELRGRLEGVIEITTGLSLAYVAYILNVTIFTLLYPLVAGRKEILILTPIMNDLRGDIMASSGARMNTLLHLGEVKPSGTELMRAEAPPLSAVTLITVSIMTFSIYVYSALFREDVKIETLYLVGIMASLAATLILFPSLSAAIAEIFRRGREPGNLIPTLATVGGDLISFPLLVTSFLTISAVPEGAVPLLFFLALSLSIALSIALLMLYSRARRVLAERTVVLGIIMILQPLAGVLLAVLEEALAERGLIQIAVSFIGLVGALSSIVGLRLSVHLHLYGTTDVAGSFYRALTEVMISALPASLMLAAVGYASQRLLYGELHIPIVTFALITLIAMTLAVLVGALVAMAISTLAYRVGLDPDNVAVPSITTVMDSLGILILYAVSTIFL